MKLVDIFTPLKEGNIKPVGTLTATELGAVNKQQTDQSAQGAPGQPQPMGANPNAQQPGAKQQGAPGQPSAAGVVAAAPQTGPNNPDAQPGAANPTQLTPQEIDDITAQLSILKQRLGAQGNAIQ